MSDFNELPAHVWPRGARREEDGVVCVAGVPLPELAEQYGTPLYVFDEDDFRARCREMADAFGGPEHVHYASKAFITKRVVNWVNEEGLCLDVASLNEMKVALAADFPAEDFGFGAFLASVDVILMGRATYELMIANGETLPANVATSVDRLYRADAVVTSPRALPGVARSDSDKVASSASRCSRNEAAVTPSKSSRNVDSGS